LLASKVCNSRDVKHVIRGESISSSPSSDDHPVVDDGMALGIRVVAPRLLDSALQFEIFQSWNSAHDCIPAPNFTHHDARISHVARDPSLIALDR
jgi:hypothetical protein